MGKLATVAGVVLGLVLVPASGAAQDCNCENYHAPAIHHHFDSNPVEVGYNNPHAGGWGYCIDEHDPWFCNGGFAQRVIDASDAKTEFEAITSFTAQVATLSLKKPADVVDFVRRFRALASFDPIRGAVVIESCKGPISVVVGVEAAAALRAAID